VNERKIIAAAGIFAALTCVKLLIPGASAAVRSKTADVLTRGQAFAAVSEQTGARASVRSETDAEPTAADIEDWGLAANAPVCYLVEEAVTAGEYGQPQPEAVAVFLASQMAFPDATLPENVDSGYTVLPFDFAVPVSGRNSSGFGYRLHPILHQVRFHYGTDFAANTGEAVLAFADGTVTFAGYDESYGWHVRIDHGDGWESHSAHCSSLNVSEGQCVKAGDCIALVGATGLATGPHLHFELTRDGSYVNPEYYINQ